MRQNPTLIFRADYIEHHFEARAMLPPILDALCNRLFLFCLHSKLNDRPNGILRHDHRRVRASKRR